MEPIKRATPIYPVQGINPIPNSIPQTLESVGLDKFEGNSTRSVLTERYDLIPKEAITALARRLALGAKKHGENNWKQGGLKFIEATKNHLVKHLFEYLETGKQEDLDAMICNVAFLCYFQAKSTVNENINIQLMSTDQLGI